MTREVENKFRDALEAAIEGFELDALSEEQTGQMVKHFSLLCRWNRRINLTRIIEPQEAATLHYAESLFGARFIGGARTVLDIGSGAGFPAVPLAVARAEISITALEANQKKSLFLKEAKDELGLSSLEVANARLEEFDWADYDVLTSRALDRAEETLPSIIERMKPKQRMMLYCARDLIAKLGAGTRCEIKAHPIPGSEARMVAIFTSE